MGAAIASIMHRSVYPVGMDDSVADVEALLQSHRISFVPVYDSDGTVLGIITSSDLVRFHALGKDPCSVHAWQLCTYRPLEVPPDMPLEQVARLMLERNVQHVVVAQDGAMKGIVSALDFVRLAAATGHAPDTRQYRSALSVLKPGRARRTTLPSRTDRSASIVAAEESVMFEKLNVGDICNRAVVIATEDMSLKEAAGLMRDQHVGSLVAVRPAELGNIVTGMITDRDIAIVAVARDFDPQALRVSDVMTSEIVTVRPDATMHEALALMRQRGTRRLPVTTEAGALIGLVTLDDLLEVFAEELQGFVQAMAVEQRQEARTRG